MIPVDYMNSVSALAPAQGRFKSNPRLILIFAVQVQCDL